MQQRRLTSLVGLSVFLVVLGLRALGYTPPSPVDAGTTTTPSGPATTAATANPTTTVTTSSNPPATTAPTSPPTTTIRPGHPDTPGIATAGTVRFPSTVVGGATTQAFQIASTGTAPLRLGGFELSGDSADFAVDDRCRQLSLPPGRSCQPTVTFTPTAQGSRNATLTINQNLPGPPTHVRLTGTGAPKPQQAVQPPLLAPGQWDFGAADSSPGRLPVGHAFTVVNPNTGPLAITSATVSGDRAFSVTADGCSTGTLAPKGSCTVTVAFRPTTLGARTGGLTISSAQGGSSTAKLTGGGFVQLTLTVNGWGGTVRDDQEHTCANVGSSYSITCTWRFSDPDQASVTLTATMAVSGYTLGWGCACSGFMQTCHLYLTRDTTVSVWFQVLPH